MSRYWSELVKQLTPYVPGEQPQHQHLVKLNTNESPYPPSPMVAAAIQRASDDRLRLYPDPESRELKQAFADHHGLEPEQVFFGNGSDEVLAHTFQALLKHEAPLLFPDISYSFYPVWCELYGVQFQTVALTENFTVDVDSYAAVNGGIIIPNPNAPTGLLMPLSQIEALLRSNGDSVVVIDEAYIDFGGESATALINSYDNLLVIQTLSKSRALAGMRVGVAMGHRNLIDGLERVKNSFNSYPLDVLAQQAALASLRDDEYFKTSCAKVIATREHLSLSLRALGFEVLPSAANFIFATHPEYGAQALFEALREEGIILRYFNKPRIAEFLRISIGTQEQCAMLLSHLKIIMSA